MYLDISVSLSASNAISIQVIPGWFTFKKLSKALLRSSVASLQISVNHGLLKHFGTQKS